MRGCLACADRAHYVGLASEVTGAPGGLVEFDANGRVVREISAGSDASRGYVVAPTSIATVSGARGKLVSTSNAHGWAASARGEPVPGIVVQVWKPSDVSLANSVVLDAGPRGDALASGELGHQIG